MNLASIVDPQAKRSINAAGALRQIDTRQTHSEFAQVASYDLLALADELTACLGYCKQQGTPAVRRDEQRVQSMQAEIEVRRKDSAAWLPVASEWNRKNKIWSYFPDEGPLRRELYPKHMEFFAAGRRYRRRLACCGNKVGKSVGMGGYEMVLHATGRYPAWWPGKRFSHPIVGWIGNKSAKECRDINERILLGPPGDTANVGTGLLPAHLIVDKTPKPGIPNGTEFIYVKHVSGGVSTIQSKSFDAGRQAFQGAPEVHVIWHDEECPKPIADESAMRTMTCDGILMFTYTPIMGMTELTIEMFDQAGIDISEFALKASEDQDVEEVLPQ